MSKKNNMNVRIVAIASKIKMKQSATKILSISAATHGLAPHYPAMQQPSTHPQLVPMKQILADIVGKIFPVPGFPRHHRMGIRSPW
jgi:hypothetical protein